MPYVAKDDIMAFIGSNVTVTAGTPKNVELILYKDYINNQLNAADANSITVSLYNSFGQKMYQYSNPVISGVTDYLTLGQPASNTQGHISFDITAAQSNNLANGKLYAQVTITYSNYYPSAKTYVLPQLEIGSVAGSSISGPSGGGNVTNPGSTSGNGSGSSPYIKYNVSAINGVYPALKSVTFDSADPTQVTSIKFYNLDQNNVRNVLLENYLSKRDAGASNIGATITVVNVNAPNEYAIYEITGYNRINAEVGGGDDNDNDYTEVLVTYEDNSYSPVNNSYTFEVGQTITYNIDAYGGATGSGVAGTSGTSGIDGIPGAVGTSGTSGADGTSGLNGIDGTSGTSGISGIDGANGIDGTSGTSGVNGADGIDGANGIDGTSGTSGVNGTDGADGTSGINGADGTSGVNGADGTSGINGIDGTSGTSGVNGADGTSGINGIDGTSGTSGVNGADGTSGINGIDGTSGTSGINGIDGTSGTSGITGVDGTSGTSGVDGAPGMGITFKGAIATSASLPTSGQQIGDAYLSDDTDVLYIWDGSQWVDGGSIQGPAGASGTSGSSGVNGADGTSGINGIDGTSGTSGSSGVNGEAGAAGTSGTSGIAGAQGAQGAQGADGSSGSSGVNGEAGAAGTSGTSGVNGAQGAQGADGSSGSSGVNGEAGAAGTSGTSGVNGAQGAQGADGSSGSSGVNGEAGAAGTSGTSGVNGTAGTSGSSGINGEAGAAGTSGTSGVNGTSGTSGANGIGIPSGGTSGQVLSKVDSNPYNTTWVTPTGGSGSGSNKYLLRLNYDSSEHLIAGTGSHLFVTADGFLTANAQITGVNVDTANAIYSITVQFSESHPPTGIQVMAWQPSTYKYEVHPYRVDAADCKIDSVSANFTNQGSGQFVPNFFGAFTSTITLDVRQNFIKYGNSAGLGASSRNAHAYLMFIF
jgi:hypothetical protein